MSRLRELRLHGFKSFADATRFVFEPGINAVIGPNGSGKSNMADAVRWVLGEQSNRSLRTRRADDVIFGGSDRRKPQGMAEAILTLDNGDGWLPIEFAEVSIGRRAYRSGESEYLINGARARLRDVTELLAGGRLGANELVVVGQGTVDAALSLRPEERRQLFEEAAGVKALQVRRNEAGVRLGKARDNLTRVTDLVAELKPQVRRLAVQAEHQQAHDALRARARALVTATYRRRERAAREALGEARRVAAAAEAALEAFRASQEQGRRAVSEAEERYWEADQAARQAATARESTREALIRLEARVEGLAARLAEAATDLEQSEAELAALEQRAAAVPAAQGDTAEAEISRALAASSAAEEAWRLAIGELAAADERLLAAEEAVAAVRARDSDRIVAAARTAEEDARRAARLDQARRERRELQAEIGAAVQAVAAAREAARQAEAEAVAASAAMEQAERSRDEAQRDADVARTAALEVAERLRAARAELQAIADPADARRRLSRRLVSAGWAALLDAVAAPAEAWAAVEAVVGGELESALIWSQDDPTDQLPEARGSAHLLAADGAGTIDVAERDAALAAVRGERTLDEWLGAGARRVPAAFARVVLAHDLAALLAGWRALPPGWSAVTRDGDLADGRGVIVLRGRGEPPGGESARAHARRRELGDVVGALERQSAEIQSTAHATTQRLRIARERHLAAGETADTAQRAVRDARDAVGAVEASLGRLEGRARALDAEVAGAQADGGIGDQTSAADLGELTSLQRVANEARANRDAIARRRDEARATWTAARAGAEAAEMATANRRHESALREARIAQLRAAVPALRRSLEALSAEHASADTALQAARATDDEAARSTAQAETTRESRRRELLELERGHGDAGARLADLERASQAAAIDASRRDEALSMISRERDLALEGLVGDDAPAAPVDAAIASEVEALDDEALEVELRRVRRTLAQIGSVNPFAVEEHRELAARLDEMTTQETDLRDAITATEELIARLDTEIAQQFDAAFRAIGERFDEYCRLLFAGGSGSLSMGDEGDGEAPSGIEIVVRPPGKRLQRLSMLSGGERALTGVALLFAMLSVNPVPFCILDEVDAALDEANIGRFAEALRRLSESIDFVVITHNRATIEVADTIYGVTMTDAAVSRVLSLRLADLPAEVTVEGVA